MSQHLRKYSDEVSNSLTYGIIAMFQLDDEFPGCDKLGLNPDIASEKTIADAIVYAYLAGRNWTELGDATQPYGQLMSMITYGIVNINDIKKAYHTMINRNL